MLTLLAWVTMTLGTRNASAPPLESSLRKLGVASAIVLQSQAVDEHPIWSPDGLFLAVNVDGNWMKLTLDGISLTKGTWHDGEGIGVADPPPSLTEIAESKVREWEKSAHFAPRRVATKAGTVVELRQDGLGTLLVISRKDKKPVVLWKTSLENCHGLALSPDDSLVAYVCELNGVIVTVLDR
jgi:hypothetical protein